MVHRARLRLWGGAVPALLAAVACTPTFDWRDVTPEGGAVQALFPCRPTRQARTVPLGGGAPVEMTLLACDAGDATFALAFADVADPARVPAAMAGLAHAAAANLGPAPPAASAVFAVRGMTPSPLAQRLRLAGARPDGTAVQAESAVFTRGTRVYQATVVARRMPAQAADTFFEALRLPS